MRRFVMVSLFFAASLALSAPHVRTRSICYTASTFGRIEVLRLDAGRVRHRRIVRLLPPKASCLSLAANRRSQRIAVLWSRPSKRGSISLISIFRSSQAGLGREIAAWRVEDGAQGFAWNEKGDAIAVFSSQHSHGTTAQVWGINESRRPSASKAIRLTKSFADVSVCQPSSDKFCCTLARLPQSDATLDSIFVYRWRGTRLDKVATIQAGGPGQFKGWGCDEGGLWTSDLGTKRYQFRTGGPLVREAASELPEFTATASAGPGSTLMLEDRGGISLARAQAHGGFSVEVVRPNGAARFDRISVSQDLTMAYLTFDGRLAGADNLVVFNIGSKDGRPTLHLVSSAKHLLIGPTAVLDYK